MQKYFYIVLSFIKNWLSLNLFYSWRKINHCIHYIHRQLHVKPKLKCKWLLLTPLNAHWIQNFKSHFLLFELQYYSYIQWKMLIKFSLSRKYFSLFVEKKILAIILVFFHFLFVLYFTGILDDSLIKHISLLLYSNFKIINIKVSLLHFYA